MKRRIISLLTAVTLVASLFTAVPASAAGTYKSFDLSLTQTTFSGLGETGSIKANLIETVDTLPQRKAITEGTVTYTTADSSVIALNGDGTFTTVGYGVANVKVVYDNNTADPSDDASSKVMITVSDSSKLEIYPGEDNTIYTKKDGAAPASSALNGNYQLTQDPVGTADDPLVIHSIDDNGAGEATDAVAPGETAVFSGWFYDTTQKNGQNFIGFGYAGTTDATSVLYDGNSSIGITAQDISNYKLLGGVYSSSKNTTNYGKFAVKANTVKDALAGVQNAGTRTIGWHQFVVTAETSIVNPGTDYMLVKAYLDGELITSQDIYVGNVPVEKRRFNIYLAQRLADDADVYYKDLSVKTFKRSGVIAETLPSDNAVNVPLRQLIKVKLASARASVPSVSVTTNGGIVSSSASLDSTGTIVTVNAGKLAANTEYVVDVEGESFNFTTGSDSEMSAMIDGMTDYRMIDTRYVDFADSDKTAEEYGVGYVHNNPGTKSEVKDDNDDNYLTMTEGTRVATTTQQNGIIIRNISPRNGDADRVVVSYKFRPQSIGTDQAYGSAGIGRPYMAIYNSDDTYNNLTTAALSGATDGSNSPKYNSKANGYRSIAHHMLKNNNGSTAGHAFTKNKKRAQNAYFYIPIPEETQQSLATNSYVLTADDKGWYRLTYVIDVDKNGVNPPDWTTIWGNDLDDEYSIFELEVSPTKTTAYTSVDSIYIPTANYAAINSNIVIDIKDIEVYQLAKTLQATIDEQPVVTEAGTETEVLAGNLAGKTVDVAINAQGNGEAYTVIVAAITDTNRLLNAKTGSGKLGTSKNIGVEGFAIPTPEDGEEVKLYVFVWDSFENVVPLFKKIEYTKAQ